MSDSCDLWTYGPIARRLLCPWEFPSKNTGVGCHFLLQGIFLTQEPNPGLQHCRQILYRPSQVGSPTCRGATKPGCCCNYEACALEPESRNDCAHTPQLLKPELLEPVLRNERSRGGERPVRHIHRAAPSWPQPEKARALTKIQDSQTNKQNVKQNLKLPMKGYNISWGRLW